MISKPTLQIGSVSSTTEDNPHAMVRMVKHGNVDVLIGDWLSEMNIAWNAIIKQQNLDLGYERGFLDQLEESLDDIIAQGLKVITNAGALNTRSLARELGQGRNGFSHLDHAEKQLDDWELKPVCGAAYIRCRGIIQALNSGAQIVDDYDALAGALIAGHLTECGPYVTGANFTEFKEIMDDMIDLTFPIAEINSRGECVVTTLSDGGGRVTEDTVRAQILYEL
ncbi:hypothetical protein AYO21_10702 [Fonsecaea monophora]|uniref:Acyclic terpene utilisation N-terminal domain-containing protein n=1 Tax=Fonsecaea monophora TaxID=254056 RepID=A0A177ESY1_9EURO|nr:hypothetical protein AYO21_10702 [Fonsecaea monophora]OAG35135.1 hypothetical protein AYO21_10702 [Fonsecaea monophora]